MLASLLSEYAPPLDVGGLTARFNVSFIADGLRHCGHVQFYAKHHTVTGLCPAVSSQQMEALSSTGSLRVEQAADVDKKGRVLSQRMVVRERKNIRRLL